MNLLHIDSSILGDHSSSRELSAAATAALVAGVPGLKVTYRDLVADPLPHYSAADLAALSTGENSETLDQFLTTDIAVIGVALYNFTVPSQLKAWIDRLCIAGRTFRYTEKGPEGLLGDKRVILTIARGGFYGVGSPAASLEHAETISARRLCLPRRDRSRSHHRGGAAGKRGSTGRRNGRGP